MLNRRYSSFVLYRGRLDKLKITAIITCIISLTATITLAIASAIILSNEPLPEPPQPAATSIATRPIPTNAYVETTTISTLPDNRERMVDLIKHDVSNSGGYVLSSEEYPNERRITVTLVAASDYIKRLEPIKGKSSIPDTDRLHQWANDVINNPARQSQPTDVDTRFTVFIDFKTYHHWILKYLVDTAVTVGILSVQVLLLCAVEYFRRARKERKESSRAGFPRA